jgi:hypothetical protein
MHPDSNTNQRATFMRFPLGQTYITPGAEERSRLVTQQEFNSLWRKNTRRYLENDRFCILKRSTTILLPSEY